MPTASITASGPMPPVISISASSTCGLLEVDHLGAELLRELEPVRIVVDGDHLARAHEERALHREEPDRAAAPDRDGVALLDVGVLRRHPAGRQDVGEEQHLLVLELPSGMTIGPTSEKGTRTYSACPPA